MATNPIDWHHPATLTSKRIDSQGIRIQNLRLIFPNWITECSPRARTWTTFPDDKRTHHKRCFEIRVITGWYIIMPDMNDEHPISITYYLGSTVLVFLANFKTLKALNKAHKKVRKQMVKRSISSLKHKRRYQKFQNRCIKAMAMQMSFSHKI